MGLIAPALGTTACTFSASGTSYDLTGLQLPSYYRVSDVRQSDTTYWFQVCSGGSPPPGKGCNPQEAAPAWQVEASTSSCYSLGAAPSQGWNFSFVDPNLPARGVRLQYSGGDSSFCPYMISGGNIEQRERSLSIDFVCSSAQSFNSELVNVLETNQCDYSLQIPSIYGCPRECLTGTSVCSGNGVCGFNNDASRSQCYCYSGYTGASCDSRAAAPDTGSTGITGEGIVLIIVCIALALTLGMAGFMFLRLQRLSIAPSAYGRLQGRYNAVGQVA